MANRKITSLVALAAPAIDDVLPIIDISETGNDLKNKKITYGELFKSLPDGSNTAPAIAFNSSTSTGLYRSAANELSIATTQWVSTSRSVDVSHNDLRLITCVWMVDSVTDDIP